MFLFTGRLSLYNITLGKITFVKM